MNESKKIIIYGAGKRGKSIALFFKSMDMLKNVDCFCDKNASNISSIEGIPVVTLDVAIKKGLPFWISVVAKPLKDQIIEDLSHKKAVVFQTLADAVMHYNSSIDTVDFNRKYCSFHHIDNMDSYFEVAETEENLNIFWSESSLFHDMFKTLDLVNVIELACGRGRHVKKYIELAGHVTLVDILQKNIDFCAERYKKHGNISYYKNNGFDLAKLDSNKYTSLFTYDAMVHFEAIDIYFYLKDVYRVLKPGGYALFHHSNNYDKNASFSTTQSGRNFMSDVIFSYFSFCAGFEVVRQEIIDWEVKNLDCITLVKKPL